MQSLVVCGENFINTNCTLAVSSGDTYKERLRDNKRALQWPTVGSTEGVAATVQVDFKNRTGSAVSRTFNRIILLNHNLKNFYIEYWDGAAWQSVAESVFTTNTATDNYIVLAASISTTKLRLTATNTIGAVAEKLIGEFMACLFVAAVRHIVTLDRADWDDGGDYRLDDGTLVTYMRTTKFEAKVSLEQMSQATYLLVEPLIRTRASMVWVLHYDFSAADIFHVVATSQPETSLDPKMELYKISFQVKER